MALVGQSVRGSARIISNGSDGPANVVLSHFALTAASRKPFDCAKVVHLGDPALDGALWNTMKLLEDLRRHAGVDFGHDGFFLCSFEVLAHF